MYGKKKSAHAFKRSISEENISKAFMITVLSAGILCVATFLMCVFEPEYDFIQIIFEVASALSTADFPLESRQNLVWRQESLLFY